MGLFGFSFFCGGKSLLAASVAVSWLGLLRPSMAASLSTSSGSALIALSIVQACSVSCIVRTPDGVTIKKATGVIETPAPEPPPNMSLLALAPTSEPPEAKPKVTRETG